MFACLLACSRARLSWVCLNIFVFICLSVWLVCWLVWWLVVALCDSVFRFFGFSFLRLFV